MENIKPGNKTEKIREAVKRFPYLIPMYMKDPTFDPKITYGIMKKILPLRFSIEFECLGTINENKTIDSKKHGNQFGVYSLNRDKWTNESNDPNYWANQQSLNEHRVSVLGFRQLVGFHKVLETMKSDLISCPGSGIHIHIDISPFIPDKIEDRRGTYERWLENIRNQMVINLDMVYEIFGSKYTGEYNRKSCRIDQKGNWVNIRSGFKTIEFRIGELTFDYEELIDIVIKLQKLTKEVMRKAHKISLQKGYNITKYHPLREVKEKPKRRSRR